MRSLRGIVSFVLVVLWVAVVIALWGLGHRKLAAVAIVVGIIVCMVVDSLLVVAEHRNSDFRERVAHIREKIAKAKDKAKEKKDQPK